MTEFSRLQYSTYYGYTHAPPVPAGAGASRGPVRCGRGHCPLGISLCPNVSCASGFVVRRKRVTACRYIRPCWKLSGRDPVTQNSVDSPLPSPGYSTFQAFGSSTVCVKGALSADFAQLQLSYVHAQGKKRTLSLGNVERIHELSVANVCLVDARS